MRQSRLTASGHVAIVFDGHSLVDSFLDLVPAQAVCVAEARVVSDVDHSIADLCE